MKPYEEIAFPNGYLRWIREGDEYVCRMSDGYMRKMKALHESRALIPDQQRKPLTDEEILTVARDHYNPHQRPEISFARAIEAAHGIKE